MSMIHPDDHRDGRPDVEASWAQLYRYVYGCLRSSQPFIAWLKQLLPQADVEAGPVQLERWRDGTLGHRLLMAPRLESIGLILAVALPSHGTFRFAFPLPDDFLRHLSLLAHQQNNEPTAVPDEEILRHILTQMNFSCGESWGLDEQEASIRESMMWAAFVSGRAVYCGDVFDLETDQNKVYVVPGTDVQFRSVDEDAQRSWAMSSAVYVPCQFANVEGSPQGFTLALYSPHADLFPGFLKIQDVQTSIEEREPATSRAGERVPLLAAAPPPEWVEWFTEKVIPYAWYRALVQQDELARYAAHATLGCVDDLFHRKVEGAPGKVRELISMHRQSAPRPIDGGTPRTEAALDFDLDAVLRDLGEYLVDGHVRNLQFLRAGFRELATSTRGGIRFDLVQDILRYVAILNRGARSGSLDEYRLVFAGVDDPLAGDGSADRLFVATKERLGEEPLALWAAVFLNALVKNALHHGNPEFGPAVVASEWKDAAVRFVVSNPVAFSRELLVRYWTVREGILPIGSAGSTAFGVHEDSAGHGVQLFLLRHLPREAGLRVDFQLEPPRREARGRSPALATWRSILRVRARKDSL
jgi:hypothetical protein